MPPDYASPLAPPPSSRAADEDPEHDLAGALHEVSNSLTVIVGWLDRIRAEGAEGPELARALEIIYARACDGRHIARRAIGAAPLVSAGEMPLDALLTEALAGVLPEATARGITLSPPEIDGEALVGKARIALQILTNLLLNAVSFSPPQGRIRVEAHESGFEVCMRVLDEGPGVLPERRDRVFHRGRTTRDGGAGIGLFHARALARRCGGDLVLEASERGASFLLRWPRATSRSSPPPSRGPEAGIGGRRVLVVEDDGAVLILLEMALSARGAEVVCARSAVELEAALSAGSFDAALVDLSPIADDVARHLRALRAQSPAVRIIVISGSAIAPGEEALAMAAAWVRKPFDLGEIMAALSPDLASGLQPI